MCTNLVNLITFDFQYMTDNFAVQDPAVDAKQEKARKTQEKASRELQELLKVADRLCLGDTGVEDGSANVTEVAEELRLLNLLHACDFIYFHKVKTVQLCLLAITIS